MVAAAIVVKRHGEDAPVMAAMRADGMLDEYIGKETEIIGNINETPDFLGAVIANQP